MAETPSRTTALKEQYGTQVATDLEHNAKEQDRLRREIDALNDQLLSLQQDHTVLVSMQQALGILTPEPTPAAEEAVAAPSLPRQKATAPAAGKRTRTKKAAASQNGKQAKEKKPAAKATAPKAAQPTLVELIRHHLTEQSEPRSAAEIATALTQTHPDRRIQTNVVRTTLEGLVAKSKAQRTRQGSSVYYTAPESQEPTPAQADSEPVPASS